LACWQNANAYGFLSHQTGRQPVAHTYLQLAVWSHESCSKAQSNEHILSLVAAITQKWLNLSLTNTCFQLWVRALCEVRELKSSLLVFSLQNSPRNLFTRGVAHWISQQRGIERIWNFWFMNHSTQNQISAYQVISYKNINHRPSKSVDTDIFCVHYSFIILVNYAMVIFLNYHTHISAEFNKFSMPDANTYNMEIKSEFHHVYYAKSNYSKQNEHNL
jgi:hypothetical protein